MKNLPSTVTMVRRVHQIQTRTTPIAWTPPQILVHHQSNNGIDFDTLEYTSISDMSTHPEPPVHFPTPPVHVFNPPVHFF